MTKKESLPNPPKFCGSGSAVRHLFWRLLAQFCIWAFSLRAITCTNADPSFLIPHGATWNSESRMFLSLTVSVKMFGAYPCLCRWKFLAKLDGTLKCCSECNCIIGHHQTNVEWNLEVFTWHCFVEGKFQQPVLHQRHIYIAGDTYMHFLWKTF